MSDFAIEYALAINGQLYREPKPNYAMPWMSFDSEPVIFTSKTDAVTKAGQIRDLLRDRFNIDPIITVVHRYCSDWTGGDIGEELEARFTALLAEEDSDG